MILSVKKYAKIMKNLARNIIYKSENQDAKKSKKFFKNLK